MEILDVKNYGIDSVHCDRCLHILTGMLCCIMEYIASHFLYCVIIYTVQYNKFASKNMYCVSQSRVTLLLLVSPDFQRVSFSITSHVKSVHFKLKVNVKVIVSCMRKKGAWSYCRVSQRRIAQFCSTLNATVW